MSNFERGNEQQPLSTEALTNNPDVAGMTGKKLENGNAHLSARLQNPDFRGALANVCQQSGVKPSEFANLDPQIKANMVSTAQDYVKEPRGIVWANQDPGAGSFGNSAPAQPAYSPDYSASASFNRPNYTIKTGGEKFDAAAFERRQAEGLAKVQGAIDAIGNLNRPANGMDRNALTNALNSIPSGGMKTVALDYDAAKNLGISKNFPGIGINQTKDVRLNDLRMALSGQPVVGNAAPIRPNEPSRAADMARDMKQAAINQRMR